MLPDAVKTENDPEEAEPRPAARSERRRPPPWQILVALVLVLVAFAGLCQVTGLARLLRPQATPTSAPTATIVPTAMAVPTATSIPTVVPTDTPVPTATPAPAIGPGGQVIVQGTEGQQLRLRAGPALDNVTLRILDEGTKLTVLEGPEASDGFQWWRVQTEDGLIGWVASDWLVPVVP